MDIGEFIRESGETPNYSNPDHFTLEIHHGGTLVTLNPETGESIYEGGKVVWADYCNLDYMSLFEFDGISRYLGYTVPPLYYYRLAGYPSNFGWEPVLHDQCVLRCCEHQVNRVASVYYVTSTHQNLIQNNEAEPDIIDLEKQAAGWEEEAVGGAAEGGEAEVDGGEAEVDGGEAHVEADDSGKGPACSKEVEADYSGKRPACSKEAESLYDVPIGTRSNDKGKAPMVEESDDEEAKSNCEDDELSKGLNGDEDDEYDEDDEDYRYVDSEYEQEVEDINIFDYVDMDIHSDDDCGSFGEVQSDDMGNEDDIWNCDEDDAVDIDHLPAKERRRRKLMPKFTYFRKETDMRDPKFKLGQVYESVELFRAAIKEYSIINQKDIIFAKNHKLMVRAKCAKGCPWHLYGSYDRKNHTFVVRTYINDHKCTPPLYNGHANAVWMANRYGAEFRMNPNWDMKAFKQRVQQEFNVTVSTSQFYRARQIAMKEIHGHIDDQYAKLWDYLETLQQTNENTTCKVKADWEGDSPRFRRCYICFGASKRGYLDGCRPVIGLDGCFIKGHYKGQLLSAIGVDANNGMFPIAYAVVEIENRSSWTWFLTLLIDDLGIENSWGQVLISDKQKGLVDAIKDLLPNAEHRNCVKHMAANFRKKHPGLFLYNLVFSAAKSTTEPRFLAEMDKMRDADSEAHGWFHDKPPQNWCQAYFRTHAKCDLILNNLCESFNAAILTARDLPILHMLEKIRLYVMLLMARRREACQKWNHPVCPRIREIISERKKECNVCIVSHSGAKKYQVDTGNGMWYAVDLDTRSCSCRKWEVSGIPCNHAMACIFRHGKQVEEYVDEKYLIESYMATYAPMINPLPGPDMWLRSGKPPLKPPAFKTQPGRPRRVRARDASEPKAPSNPHKLRKYDVTIKCKKCGKEGHNSRTCGRQKIPTQVTKAQNPEQAVQPKPKKQRMKQRPDTPPRRMKGSSRPVSLSQPTASKSHDTSQVSMSQPATSSHQVSMSQPTRRFKSPAKRNTRSQTSLATEQLNMKKKSAAKKKQP